MSFPLVRFLRSPPSKENQKPSSFFNLQLRERKPVSKTIQEKKNSQSPLLLLLFDMVDYGLSCILKQTKITLLNSLISTFAVRSGLKNMMNRQD